VSSGHLVDDNYKLAPRSLRSRDGVVSLVIRLRTGPSEIPSPGRATVLSSPKTSRPAFRSTQPPMGTTSCFLGGTGGPGRQADCSRPPSARVKNELSYNPTPPIFLHGVERDNFTFLPKIHPQSYSHVCLVHMPAL
jgi:hypothetical protein